MLSISRPLSDLKVGVSERTIFGALHPDAMHLFNICSDIKKVCWSLWNIEKRLEDKVSLFGFAVGGRERNEH
jgi:hypothetical protein